MLDRPFVSPSTKGPLTSYLCMMLVTLGATRDIHGYEGGASIKPLPGRSSSMAAKTWPLRAVDLRKLEVFGQRLSLRPHSTMPPESIVCPLNYSMSSA